ncbi:MAG: hypothetical protein KBA30_01220 [Clostridia bacterium]|nr:hypothetical protein [Clostridia bacterium]
MNPAGSDPPVGPPASRLYGLRVFAVCLVLSAAFLAIGTRSSPLYPTNDWVDSNAMFTVGRGMMNGQVPYRDLFEQKGPLLYFLYGLASLVSDRSFVGVYLLETLSFAAYLSILWRTVLVWSAGRRPRPAVLPVLLIPLAAFTVNTSAFTLGGSAEELCLPLLAAGILLLSVRIRDRGTDRARGPAGRRELVLAGMLAGCVLWMKYTMLGFWLGWVFAVLILIPGRRPLRKIVAEASLFLAGMLAASLPWAAYFLVNGAVGDAFHAYFTVNIQHYPNHSPLWFRPFASIGLFFFHGFHNLPLVLAMAWGAARLFFGPAGRTGGKRLGLRALLPFLLCLVCQAVATYIGLLAYSYYFLSFAPFAVFGAVAALPGAERLAARIGDGRVPSPGSRTAPLRRRTWAAASVLLAVALSLSYLYNPNVRAMGRKSGDSAQERFAAIIRADPDPSLLNYGYLDHGFYLAAGLLPEVRFFENQNIPRERYPLILDEQGRYIAERQINFVVLRVGANEPEGTMVPAVLAGNYDRIAVHWQEYRKVIYRYELYRVKDDRMSAG